MTYGSLFTKESCLTISSTFDETSLVYLSSYSVGANTLSNIPTGSLGQASNAAMTNAATAGATSAPGTLGNMSAGALTGAAGQASGSLATAGAQSALDAAKEQEALAAAALAKFNKPLPQLSEEELRQLVNDPLNRNVDGGIYNYQPV